MLYKLSIALVLLAICQSYGQQLLPFGCPQVTYMNNFDLPKYTGLWYQIERYPTVFEIGQKCTTAEYGVGANNTVTVLNSAITILTGQPTDIEGYANVLGPGILSVVFPVGNLFPQNGSTPNYIVLGTDYENYAVVASCRDLIGSHAQFVWILSRNKNPDAETFQKINEVLKKNGISRNYLIKTEQDNCPAANA